LWGQFYANPSTAVLLLVAATNFETNLYYHKSDLGLAQSCPSCFPEPLYSHVFGTGITVGQGEKVCSTFFKLSSGF
jgi:hypothetical protein